MPSPCKKGHEWPGQPDTCTHCRGRIPAQQPGRAPRLPPARCAHLGQPTGEEIDCPTCGGRKVRLKVLACAVHGRCLPAKKLDGIACCQGCPDMQVANLRPKPAGILIPEPPALDLSPTRPLALVTVVAGEEAERCFAVSGPLMRAYAERLGADFIKLTWPGHPAWPMSAKFAIPRAARSLRSRRLCRRRYLAPARLPRSLRCLQTRRVRACDELPFHRWQPQHGRERAYLQFRRDMGFGEVPNLPWYLNLGVMIVPRSCRDILRSPRLPIIPSHCAEQDHSNARLLDEFLAGRVKVRMLDRRCNWQNWTDHGFQAAPPDAILHWSGAGGNRVQRNVEMAEWSRRFSTPVSAP